MSTLRSEERKTVGCQSTHLSSRSARQRVKPTDPNYDAFVLAFIKSKVVIDANGCWLWQGFIGPDVVLKSGKVARRGYGYIGYRNRNLGVHRVVWMIQNGPQPKGKQVCHTCDVRRCCNPDHLWLGTNRDNITDMTLKGHGVCGQRKYATHCKHGHEFTPENTLIHSGKWRACKECQRIHQRQPHRVAWMLAYQKRRRAAKRAARLAQEAQS